MKEGIHYSTEIESAVLGICLLEKDAFGRTYKAVDDQSFYVIDNQTVYRSFSEMNDKSIPIDLLTTWEYMTSQNITLNWKPGIAAYLSKLSMSVVNSAHLEYHCHLIKKMWRKRELEKLTTSGIDTTGDERKQIYELNQQLNDILGTDAKKDWQSMDELMFNLMVHQQDMKTGKKTFVTTGFRAIDRANGGFTGGQMIVLGARPSVGKSALMGKIALSAATKGHKVGIISLEMNNTEIAGRLASMETDVEFWKIYRNLFDDEAQGQRFYNIVSNRSINLPIYVSDKTKVDINEIKSKAAKLKHTHGLDLLMIDYLQLIDGTTENKNYNREQEVAKMSRGIKLLANDMNIPIVVLCQLNRAVTHRSAKDRYPKLSDLRESGAIEQDADIVMMLHRDYLSGYEVNPDTGSSTERTADLLGVKWRNGAQFHLPLDFEPEKMKFSEQQHGTLIPVTYQKEENEEEPF